ncbi:hypothetical protein GQ457_18G019690 [Hibiscus cannabinus]
MHNISISFLIPFRKKKTKKKNLVLSSGLCVLLVLEMVKRNLGRQKIEMVKMENESNLHVTFSKRRAGLFKKASEITTLCGAELALLVFSPAQRVYSFGHPSVDAVIDRYLGGDAPETSVTSRLVKANRESNVHQLNMELTQLTSQLENKKKRGEELKQITKENRWQAPIAELDRSQLLQLRRAMQGLKNNVNEERLAILNANPHLFYTGNSSGTNNSNMAFDANMNMMDGGYIVPPPGYNPNPTVGSNANSLGGHGFGGGNDIPGPQGFGGGDF